MEATVPLVSGGRFIDIEAYTRHNEAFHNGLVDLADNPTLFDAYRALGVAGLMVSLIGEGSEAGPEIIDDHRAIVDAYERGSLDEAMRVIARHNENAKENHPPGDRRRRRQTLRRSSRNPPKTGVDMADRTYVLNEIVGTSTESVNDAIKNGVRRASRTLRNVDWFEVIEVRGAVVDGEVGHYQVTMKVGFRLEDPQET